MSGECNICGDMHAEGACPVPAQHGWVYPGDAPPPAPGGAFDVAAAGPYMVMVDAGRPGHSDLIRLVGPGGVVANQSRGDLDAEVFAFWCKRLNEAHAAGVAEERARAQPTPAPDAGLPAAASQDELWREADDLCCHGWQPDTDPPKGSGDLFVASRARMRQGIIDFVTQDRARRQPSPAATAAKATVRCFRRKDGFKDNTDRARLYPSGAVEAVTKAGAVSDSCAWDEAFVLRCEKDGSWVECPDTPASPPPAAAGEGRAQSVNERAERIFDFCRFRAGTGYISSEAKPMIEREIDAALRERDAEWRAKLKKMGSEGYPDRLDADGVKAPVDFKDAIWRAAEQAGKRQWFNVWEHLRRAQVVAENHLRSDLNKPTSGGAA